MKYLKKVWDFINNHKQAFIFVIWIGVSIFMSSKKKSQVHIHHNYYYMCDSILMANLNGQLND